MLWAASVTTNQVFEGSLPLPASDVAVMWDKLYHFLVYLSIFFFVLVVGAMIYFAIRYRVQKGEKTKFITDHHVLEALWTAVPALLLMGIFVWGWNVYRKMTHAPADAYEVHVVGKQWLWQFQYPNGKQTIGELVVPLGRPTKLIMSSEDVIHGFFIPAFRVKSDVVPGMYTSIWFEPKVEGEHQVYCTEYCGGSHSLMLAKLTVLEERKFLAWTRGQYELASKASPDTDEVAGSQSIPERMKDGKVAHLSLPEQGRRVMEAKGCIACHSIDGTARATAPTLKGAFQKEVALTNGETTKRDEAYLRESILKPNAKIVKGFSPVMPAFQGLVSETELNALVEYIKSIQ